MLYAAKCYWPGVTQADLGSVAERAAQVGPGPGRDRVAYLGSLLFAADDLVLCLFQSPTRAAVIEVSDRLGIPCERLMEPEWLPPGQPSPKEHRNDQMPRGRRSGIARRAPVRCRGHTAAALQRPRHHAWAAGTVVIALVLLAIAGSYGAGNDNLSDLMLFATGVAVLPAWLIWTGRIGGTGDAPPEPHWHAPAHLRRTRWTVT